MCTQLPDAATVSDDGKTAIFSALLGLHDVAKFENDAPQAQRCLGSARSYANTARLQLRLANAEGTTALERGDPAQADLAFERGLTIADHAHMPPTHENRSVAYLGRARAALLTNRPAQARDFAANALTLGASRGDLKQVTESLLSMARSFRAEKATAQAASILRVAADLIEQVPIDDLDAEQRATWLATQHVAFEELTTLLAEEAGNDESRAWQAFEVSERGHARSLRYAISQATDTRATSSTEPASVRYRDLMRRITELAHTAQAASQAISLDALANQYILGVTDTARDLGYDTLLVTEADGARALRRITDSRMVDGVVLMNIAQEDPRLPILRAAPQPGALVGLPGDCSGLDVFDLDFEEAGRVMVDHLHRLGHRELILVSQPEHVVERGGAYVWRLRDAALERARQLGITLHAVYGESRQPAVGRLLNGLLDAHPSATGLLINNEAAAAALPSVTYQRGLRVPEDLSVIGRYSAEFAATFSLPYSFIESAPDRLGSMAVRQLVRRVESPAARNDPFVVRFISPEFVSLESTAPPRPR